MSAGWARKEGIKCFARLLRMGHSLPADRRRSDDAHLTIRLTGNGVKPAVLGGSAERIWHSKRLANPCDGPQSVCNPGSSPGKRLSRESYAYSCRCRDRAALVAVRIERTTPSSEYTHTGRTGVAPSDHQ